MRGLEVGMDMETTTGTEIEMTNRERGGTKSGHLQPPKSDFRSIIPLRNKASAGLNR